LIHSALHGAAHSARVPTAVAMGQTTKVVRCEACGKSYAYQLTRTGHGAADRSSGGGHSVALQRAEADLQRFLAIGVEAAPCPACGWYQSDMIPQARRRHRRWMVYVGQCLTVGLIPLAVFGLLIIDGFPEAQGLAPVFVAGLVCLLAVGIGMFIWRHHLAKNFDPNDEDVGVRTLYGQSRAVLLSEQEARDVLGRPVVHNRPGLADDPGALVGCIFGVICVAGLVGCGGFFGVRSVIRANVASRFEKDLPAYVALSPALPPEGARQPGLPPPGGITGKVKGKMVVVNVNERKIDDLYFALPDHLRASKPEEVATVVLLTWGKIRISGNGPISSFTSVEYQMICQVRVFD